MTSNRLEAFSDGVIAVIITIMVLELKPPHEDSTRGLLLLYPAFLTYLLSFIIVAMYWVNHHHLIDSVKRLDAPTLWANLHFLFWLSLFPWVTGYVNENHARPLPVSLYALETFATGISFNLLRQIIARHHKDDPLYLKQHSRRNKLSLIALSFYFSAVALAWVWTPLALIMITIPLLLYFFPTLIFPKEKV